MESSSDCRGAATVRSREKPLFARSSRLSSSIHPVTELLSVHRLMTFNNPN